MESELNYQKTARASIVYSSSMCEMSYTDKSTFGQYNCFYGIQRICGNGLKLDSWRGYSSQLWFRSISLPSSISQEGAEEHLGHLVLICCHRCARTQTLDFRQRHKDFYKSYAPLFNQYNWYSWSFLCSFMYGGIHKFLLNTGTWTIKWHVCLVSEVILLFPGTEKAKSRNLRGLLSTFELHFTNSIVIWIFLYVCICMHICIWIFVYEMHVASQESKSQNPCLYRRGLHTNCHWNSTQVFWWFT